MAYDALNDSILYDWSPEKMIEVTLKEPDDFLKVKETLTRIGIGRNASKTLTQSCNIFHRQGRYYIVSFKEMFAINGGESSLTISDVARRNLIAFLLDQWGLVKLVKPESVSNRAPISSIKIVPYSQKKNWTLKQKYRLGRPQDSE